MTLSTVSADGTTALDDPSDDGIRSAIRDVYDERVDAVILIADAERNLFLQLGHGGWHIEHCVGPEGPVYSADEVPIELAERMFLSYLRGDNGWRSAVTWGVEIEKL